MSRRGLLRARLYLAGLAGTGCAGRGEGPEGTVVPGPEEPGAAGRRVEVRTARGSVRGVLHAAGGARAGAVLVSGASGGLEGPSGVYPDLTERLRADGFAALRLDYRRPNHLTDCVRDTLAGLDALARRGIERAVVVGWSFGGAVAITAWAASERVVGVATVASQTYGTGGVDDLSPEKSLLLIHGTSDDVLPADLSRPLYSRAGEPKALILYPDDGHGIRRHRDEMLEKLHGWSKGLLRGRPSAP